MKFLSTIFFVTLCFLLFNVLLNVEQVVAHKKSSRARYLEAALKSGRTLENVSWFSEQKVDHYDPTNTKTWSQRYTVNSTYWVTGGPIFLFLSGEAPMEFFEFQEVSALAWAEEYSALYISLEHRFYGQSNPFPNLGVSSLQYLTSQQALADAANFINWFNSTQLENPGPWVVFGCSYSGALSSWFRLKYPQLVVGSVAPSGPVYALVNFTQYLNQFSKSAPQNCVNAVSAASQQITQLLETSQGIQQLAQTFNSCHPLGQNDLYNFLNDIINTVGGADQMSNPPTWLLNETCNILTKNSNYLSNFAAAYTFNVLNPLGQSQKNQVAETCNDFSINSWLSYMKSDHVDNLDRSWYWQTCVEFGWYQSSYPPSVFPYLPVDPQVEWCEQIFGIPGMTPNVDWTNAYYGGFNLQATNVLFTNGLYDPWHTISITEDLPSGVRAVTYEAGHCGTMIKPSSIDPPSLTLARETVSQFLGEIIENNS